MKILAYIKIFFINFLIFLVGLFFLELFFVVYIKSHSLQRAIELPSFLKSYIKYNVTDIIQNKEECAKYDKELFYTLKPGNCIFNIAESSEAYSINSLGVRDDEKSLDKPEILFLGDSFTMGWGVSNEDTYAQIVENKTGMKVLNAGISSYGTAREMGLLKRIDTSNLKYLIIQYCPNDHEENLSFLKNNNILNVSSEEKFNELVKRERKKSEYYPGKYLFEIYTELKNSFITKKEYSKMMKEYEQVIKTFTATKLDKSKINADYPFGEIEAEFTYLVTSKNFVHVHGWTNSSTPDKAIVSFSFFIDGTEVPAKLTKDIPRLDLVAKLNLKTSPKIGWSAEVLLPDVIEKDTTLETIAKDTAGNSYYLKNKNKKEFTIAKTKYNEAETFLKVLSKEGISINENTQLIVISLFDYWSNPPKFLEDVEKFKTAKDYPKYINNLKVISVQESMTKDNFFRVDDHINASGHKIVAEKIYGLMKK